VNIIRIQKNISLFSTAKKWKVVSKCHENCVAQTVWFLKKQNPGQEFRIAPLDMADDHELKI